MPGWWVEMITQPPPAEVVAAGGVPTVTVTANKVIQPAAANVTVTGGVPGTANSVAPIPASVIVTGGTPTVTVTNNKFIVPAAAAVTATGGTPTVSVTANRLIQPAAATVTATGGTPTVTRTQNKFITPTAASVTATGGTPTVTVASATPPAYDATGAGTTGFSNGLSFSHTATAGAYVILAFAFENNATVSSVTYGGVAMTLLGAVAHNNDASKGHTRLYGLSSVAGGAKTVAASLSANGWIAGNTVSYTGVTSAGSFASVTGTGTSLSQSVTGTASQRIVQAFGKGTGGSPGPGAFSSLTGGTNRYNGNATNAATVTISDATTSTTFTAASAGGTAFWAGLAIVLSS